MRIHVRKSNIGKHTDVGNSAPHNPKGAAATARSTKIDGCDKIFVGASSCADNYAAVKGTAGW